MHVATSTRTRLDDFLKKNQESQREILASINANKNELIQTKVMDLSTFSKYETIRSVIKYLNFRLLTLRSDEYLLTRAIQGYKDSNGPVQGISPRQFFHQLDNEFSVSLKDVCFFREYCSARCIIPKD